MGYKKKHNNYGNMITWIIHTMDIYIYMIYHMDSYGIMNYSMNPCEHKKNYGVDIYLYIVLYGSVLILDTQLMLP